MSDFVVECGSGSRTRAVPARFGWPGRMREITAVIDRWDGDDHRYFRVRGDDGSNCILRQDLADASWRLHFYRRDEGPGADS